MLGLSIDGTEQLRSLVSPRQLAQQMKDDSLRRRGVLVGTLRNRSLGIATPEMSDEKLTKRLDQHNKAVEKFQAAMDKIDRDVSRVALAMADIGLTGKDVAGRAVAVRSARYDALQQWITLLAARQVLLGEVVEAIKSVVVDAENDLQKMRDAARRKLTNAGLGMETFPQWKQGNHPAAEIAFQHMVNRAEPVQAAAAKVQEADAMLRNNQEMFFAIPGDADKVADELIKVWRSIVGVL